MSNNEYTPDSLLEAVRYFTDLDVCHRYMVHIKWPDGKICCPKCGNESIGEIKSRRMFQCKAKECRKQFSAKVGTIFEDSALGLDKWFVAVWCIANAKNGISSCELARAIGVTQKSAWHMLHRIRLAMRTKTFRKIIGEVESDEAFFGGKISNIHPKKKTQAKKSRHKGKVIVQGLLERGGDVRTQVIANNNRRTIHNTVHDNVEPGATLITDAFGSYKGLERTFVHEVIDHAKCYVEGRIHTNSLENFWSPVKRMINGTYVAVAPDHLQALPGRANLPIQ